MPCTHKYRDSEMEIYHISLFNDREKELKMPVEIKIHKYKNTSLLENEESTGIRTVASCRRI